MAFPRKGEIYLVNFDPTIGHEVEKKRPALILSNNIHNCYSPLVTVAPLSSNVAKIYPFDVYILKNEANLNFNSKIMIIQLRSIDKERLIKRIGAVTNTEILDEISEIIREHFDLKTVRKEISEQYAADD